MKRPAKIGGTRGDWGWVAGILDGEGTFNTCVINGRGWLYPQIRINVSQSSAGEVPQMLVRLQELFGGSIAGPYHRSKSLNKKPVYTWTIAGLVRVQAIVAVIWTWLGDVKRDQYVTSLTRYMDLYRDKDANRLTRVAKT